MVGDSLRRATAVLRYRPGSVLPVFLPETALAVVGQSVTLVVAALAYLSLRDTGRLARGLSAAADVDPTDGLSATERVALDTATETLLTPTVTALVVAGVLVALAGLALGRAVTGAAKVHAAVAAVEAPRRPGDGRDRSASTGDPVRTAVAGALADWRPFLGLVGVQVLAYLGPPAVATLVAPLGTAGAALAGLVVLAWPFVALAGYLSVLFAHEAVVVEGVGLRGALAANRRVLAGATGDAAVYVVVELGVAFAALLVAGVAAALDTGRLGTVLTLFVLVPWLGLLKADRYLDARQTAGLGAETLDRPAVDGDEPATSADRPAEAPPGPDAPGLLATLLGGLGRGLRELRAFVPAHPGAVGAALATFFLGTAGGVALAADLGVPAVGGGADPGDFGAVPLDFAVSLAANNWLVSTATAYAGLGLGVPTAVTLGFNGVLVGAVSALVGDPVVFLAFVAPHGVLEIPAFAVGGGVGLVLARDVLGVLAGRTDPDALAATLRRAYHVLVGLVPVLLTAGLIEAFLTPVVGTAVQAAVGG
jgi:hypothetical protein